MKKVLLTLLSLTALSVAQAQFTNGDPGFVADYGSGQAVYCGAQGTGFYDGAGGFIGAAYSAADGGLKVTYKSTNNTSFGWFSFANQEGTGETAVCKSLSREYDPAWGADLSSNPTTQYTISVSGANQDDTLYTYIGTSTGWSASSSTYNTGSGSTIDAKIPLVNGENTYSFTYEGATWDAWTGKSLVNGFGFELKKANANLVVIVKKVAVGDEVTTSLFDNTYKAVAVKVYPNPAEGAVNVEGVSSSAVLSLKNSNGIAVKSGNGSTLSLDGLNAGLYFLEVNDNGSLKTAKVMVK